MACKNSSRPYITVLVPSSTLKTSWQTGLPSCSPRILFCLTHPQHNCQLSSNCRIFITRDDWNYKKNPAEFFTSCWASTRTGSPVPAPSTSGQLSLVHGWSGFGFGFGRELWAVDRCFLPVPPNLPPQGVGWWPWQICPAFLHAAQIGASCLTLSP